MNYAVVYFKVKEGGEEFKVSIIRFSDLSALEFTDSVRAKKYFRMQ